MSQDKNFAVLFRYACINDPTLKAVIGDRAYKQHISKVPLAAFPCTSLHIFDETLHFGRWRGEYQFDCWGKTDEDAGKIFDALFGLFCPDLISQLPAAHGCRVMFISFSAAGDGAYEPDRGLYHKYIRCLVFWKEE